MLIQEIRDALYDGRKPAFVSEHKGAGFYGVFLKADHHLPRIRYPQDGLLYIGRTKRGFSERDHVYPKSGHSGYCTLRRTIGALMKDQLQLTPMPKSHVRSSRKDRSFRFQTDCEQRLTEWMSGALYFTRVPHSASVEAVERLLIKHLRPPLNLIGWENPQAKWLRELRYACYRQAQSANSVCTKSPPRLAQGQR